MRSSGPDGRARRPQTQLGKGVKDHVCQKREVVQEKGESPNIKDLFDQGGYNTVIIGKSPEEAGPR